MTTHYTVSDGDLVLFLWPAREGGYLVTSPLDPALITQAETVEEAFVMARDARDLLNAARADQAGPPISGQGPRAKRARAKSTHRRPSPR